MFSDGHSGVPVHGPAGRSARYPALVCPPLGHGGDLCRGAQAPGCGDTTPVVGQGHCANDAGSARLVLSRDPLDQRPWCSPAGSAPWRCLVPETGPHLQRRSCGGAPVPVGGRTFQHVTSDRRHHESGNCRSRPLDCYTVLLSLNGQTRAMLSSSSRTGRCRPSSSSPLSILQIGISNFVYPMLQGRSLSLSPLAILVALAFWSWLWGIAGVLIAVPLTVAFIIVCERFPSTAWIAKLLSESASGERRR